jgi:LEA14-like dessication related protein
MRRTDCRDAILPPMARSRGGSRVLLAVVAVLGLGLAMVGATGCSVQKPTLTVTKVSVEKVDFSSATIDVVVHIENPNPFPLHMTTLSYAVDLGQSQLVQGETPNGLDINAAGGSDQTFPLTFNYASVINGLATVLQTGTIHYKISGDLGFNAHLVAVDVPLQTEGTLPLPKLPVIQPTNVSISQAGLSGVTVDVQLAVQNPNPFPFRIDSATSSLTLAGVPFADSGFGPVDAAANGTAQTDLSIGLSTDAVLALASAIQAAGSGTIPYKWQGSIVIEGITLGTQASGTLPAPQLPGF